MIGWLVVQVVELEKLRRELAYRRQLNEQQNNMISQQRAQLSMGQEVSIIVKCYSPASCDYYNCF